MTVVGDVIEFQLILALLMLCGLVLTKKEVLTEAGRTCMTDLLIDLILPCNIINSFLIEMNLEILRATLEILILSFAIQIVCWLFGKVLFRSEDPGKRSVLQYATMCSNAGFMGNPIVEGIYGSQGLLYASIYLIPLRFFMWSAGLSCFTRTSGKEIVRKLLRHPCIIAVWIGFFFLITQWSMPSPLLQTVKYISACNLPLSILIIGSIFADVDYRSIFSKDTLYYSVIRLIAIPIVSLLICRLIHMDDLVTGVCVILAGMPAGSTTAILAEKYGGDARYATKCVFVSTFLSLFTIPLLSLVMEYF